jgi:magnesium transporter
MESMKENIVKIILEENDEVVLHEKLAQFHPYDIAQAFPELTHEQKTKLCKAYSLQELADIFEYLEDEDAVEYLNEVDTKTGADIINEMEVDDAADVLNEMEDEDVSKSDAILKQLSEEDRNELKNLKHYDEKSAGSIMTTSYFTLTSGLDVKEAMRSLVGKAVASELIDPLFVVSGKRLVGSLSLRDLIIARAPKKIDEIMNTNLIYVDVNDSTVDAAQKINDYDLYALPVMENKELVGVITMDDAMDVTKEEISDDYQKMAAVGDVEDDKESLGRNILKRLPWLLVLLVLSLAVSNIMGGFEEVIQKVTVLVFFTTMILDMAGNVGTQCLAVTVRKIGRGELDKGKDVRKHLGREILINLVNALLLGLLAFAVCFLVIVIRKDNVNIVLTSGLIASAMSITLVITGLLGSLIPLLFSKIHVDPAVASGPLITTLNDMIATFTYFGLAYLFLSQIMR